MNLDLMSGLNSLGQATAGVTVIGVAIWLLLRMCRVQSWAIQRFAWLLVLLPGVIIWRIPVVLPVLPARPMAKIDLKRASEIPQSSTQSGRGFSFGKSTDQSPATAPSDSTISAMMCTALLGGWLMGMVVVAGRAAGLYLAFVRGLPRSLPALARWSAELQEVCDELLIPRRIRLHVTVGSGPALGLLPSGYRLLVPQSMWAHLTSQQRRAILRHELTHYIRGDLWKSLLARILSWPQWFNPLAWLAVRRFEEAAEWACDDAALAIESEARFDYLRALLALGTSHLSTPALQAAVHGGSLQCRVRRLLSPTGKDSRMKKFVVIAVALALSAGGFARIQLATAQSPASEKEAAKAGPTQAEPAKSPAASLLPNVGFEEIDEEVDNPKGWGRAFLTRTAGHFLFGTSQKAAHCGKRSVFVEIGENHPELQVAYNWTALADGVQPGESYELSGWIKVENANRTAFIMAQFWDAEGKDAKMIGGATTQFTCPVQGTTDWTRVTTQLTVPEGTHHLRVRAGLASQGNPGAKAWFDDISLVPAPAAVTAAAK